MTRAHERLALAVLGAALLVVVATGQYRSYVRTGMGPVLAVSGVLLLVLAVHGALREWQQHDAARRRQRFGGLPAAAAEHSADAAEHSADAAEHAAEGAGHGRHRPGGAWVLLLAPVACLALLAPPSLGAYSADRATQAVLVPTNVGLDQGWAALPSGDVVPMTFGEFVTRATWDPSRAVAGRTVRLTGFVVRQQPQGPGVAPWALARMAIMCCAADAVVYRVRIARSGAITPEPPAVDSWVEVEGVWVPPTGPSPAAGATGATGANGATGAAPEPPVLRVVRMRTVPVPEQPYDE